MRLFNRLFKKKSENNIIGNQLVTANTTGNKKIHNGRQLWKKAIKQVIKRNRPIDLYTLKSWVPIEKIDWDYLSFNPNAIEMLKRNPKLIDWHRLSANPSAIEMLQQHPERIDWHRLSENPNAIEMLKQNPERINWVILAGNPNAIEMLRQREKNRYPIHWSNLSKNPGIFTPIGKITTKIQRRFRNLIKNRKTRLERLTREIPLTPPGAYHKSYPGGVEYLETAKRYNFGKCKSKPVNTALYNRIKSKVKSKAKVWPSAYASGQLVQCRKGKESKKK